MLNVVIVDQQQHLKNNKENTIPEANNCVSSCYPQSRLQGSLVTMRNVSAGN